MKRYETTTNLLNKERVKSAQRFEGNPEFIDVRFESGHRWVRSDEEILDYITYPEVVNDDNVRKISAVIRM